MENILTFSFDIGCCMKDVMSSMCLGWPQSAHCKNDIAQVCQITTLGRDMWYIMYVPDLTLQEIFYYQCNREHKIQ